MRNSSTERFFDYAAIGVVLLNFTNLYTFLSGISGLSFKIVGSAMILFMMLYCLSNAVVLSRFISVPAVKWFLALFVVIPICTLVYAQYRELRYVAYTVNFGLIFLVTGIWVIKYGWIRFSKLIFISWAICIIGILLSYFTPSIFMRVAEIQAQAAGGWGARITGVENARAFGFYMQSNRAAHAVMMHLLILVPMFLHRQSFMRIVVVAISFGAILLTGSRGGFVIILGFSAVTLFYELKNGVRTRRGISSGISSLPKYIVLVVAVGLVGGLVMLVSIKNEKSETGQSAASRIFESLFSGGYELAMDSSVEARLQTQLVFIDRILERPLWGRGHFSGEWGMHTGLIPLAAHNMYLDLAYQYGIPLMLMCYGFLIYLAFSKGAKEMVRCFRFNPLVLMLCVFLVHSLVSSTTFDLRIFPALIAFMLVMLYQQGGGIGVLPNRRK